MPSPDFYCSYCDICYYESSCPSCGGPWEERCDNCGRPMTIDGPEPVGTILCGPSCTVDWNAPARRRARRETTDE